MNNCLKSAPETMAKGKIRTGMTVKRDERYQSGSDELGSQFHNFSRPCLLLILKTLENLTKVFMHHLLSKEPSDALYVTTCSSLQKADYSYSYSQIQGISHLSLRYFLTFLALEHHLGFLLFPLFISFLLFQSKYFFYTPVLEWFFHAIWM